MLHDKSLSAFQKSPKLDIANSIFQSATNLPQVYISHPYDLPPVVMIGIHRRLFNNKKSVDPPVYDKNKPNNLIYFFNDKRIDRGENQHADFPMMYGL